MSEYFPKPKHFSGKTEVELDLSNYLTKAGLKNARDVDTSNFAKMSDLAKLIWFSILTRTNEPKTLTKHISYECKSKFDGRNCNSNQKWNNHKCWCGCKYLKEHHECKNIYIWNSAACSCENGNYLVSLAIQWLHGMKL